MQTLSLNFRPTYDKRKSTKQELTRRAQGASQPTSCQVKHKCMKADTGWQLTSLGDRTAENSLYHLVSRWITPLFMRRGRWRQFQKLLKTARGLGKFLFWCDLRQNTGIPWQLEQKESERPTHPGRCLLSVCSVRPCAGYWTFYSYGAPGLWRQTINYLRSKWIKKSTVTSCAMCLSGQHLSWKWQESQVGLKDPVPASPWRWSAACRCRIQLHQQWYENKTKIKMKYSTKQPSKIRSALNNQADSCLHSALPL